MNDVPAGFKRIEGSIRKPLPGSQLAGAAAADEKITVTIHLRRNPSAPPLLDHDHWRKTPPGKRKFLSRQEFAAKYGATQADIDKVKAFAASHGLSVEETSSAKCIVRVTGTVQQMSAAFAVKLGTYETAKKDLKYRGLEGHIHVPTTVAEIVTNVMGLDNRPMARHHNVPAGTAVLTPPWVAQLYQFPALTAAVKNQTIAIIELGGGYTQSDIDSYFGTANPGWSPLLTPNTTHPTPGLTPPSAAAGTLVEVDLGNGKNASSSSGEVMLDIVVASSVAVGAKFVFYFSNNGGNYQGNAYATAADWSQVVLAAVHDATNNPSVISISWGGGPENDTLNNVGWSISDMQTVSAAFQTAAMMGVTVLTGSGDFGSDDGQNDGVCHLDYPASDPWVISCGGTVISNVSGSTFTENTWNDGTIGSASGGGVSEVFPVPSWQANAGVPNSKNPGGGPGRGIPDISGNASLFSGYAVVVGGTDPFPLPIVSGFSEAAGGTSIVAPLYAGLVAILNAYLGAPVGFLNPTLYALNGTSVFNDIKDGVSNQNPNSSVVAPSYTSGPGWDACTGLGSVNGTALLQALQAMQPSVSLILERSTFGQDEVNAAITAGNASYQDAFYVLVDGFTPDELGLTAANLKNPPTLPGLSGTFATLAMSNDPGIAFDNATGVLLEQPSDLFAIQRITFPYNISFATANAFSGLSAMNGSKTYGLAAKITSPATSSYVSITTPNSATAEFELVYQADPYMSAGQQWWLSEDIRVFQVTPALLAANKVPLSYSSTAFTSDANSYIQALIGELNASFTNPATANTPFTGISADEQQSALSLTQNDANGNAIYNFALARVRLTGDIANGVRVFFRLFISSSPDTDFSASTTFRSKPQTDASGNNISGTLIPLLGFPSSDMSSTIPFFAEPRIDATAEAMTRQSDPANVQTIPSPSAPAPGQGQEVYAYFGCWLDINQPTARFPMDPSTQTNPDGPYGSSAVVSIPQLIMSNHACIVAEISYDPDPIPPGANSSTSDKIGQRNLSWSGSDNPGPQDGHRVPTLFDLRYTSRNVPANALPDELMIEWGKTPAGSVASIYWPQLDAEQVLKLASRFDRSSGLKKRDAHTIECVTGKVTYIPIPVGSGPNLAGLLTIDLPLSVRVGEQFDIVVRRVTSRNPKASATPHSDTPNWRYVVGAFQIGIPVSTGAALLKTDESTLALFKWKLERLPTTNRWHPVIERYVQLLAGRVDSFGGNAVLVAPSQLGTVSGGFGPRPGHGGFVGRDAIDFTGKVTGVVYDRFGDFEGFLLLTEEGREESFRTREREIEKLVRDAWVERTVITVFVERSRLHVPVAIVLRRAR